MEWWKGWLQGSGAFPLRKALGAEWRDGGMCSGTKKVKVIVRERERERENPSPLPPPPSPKLSARAERMEWWKGWLQGSGAFPLRKALERSEEKETHSHPSIEKYTEDYYVVNSQTASSSH